MPFSSVVLDSGLVSRSLFYREEQRLRLERYQENWNMYLGNHWGQEVNEEGDPLVTVNYCAPFVEKAASFLMSPQGNKKDGVRFLPPEPPASEREANEEAEPVKTFNELSILPFVERVWENNNKQGTLMEMGMMGGITGDVFVKVGWKDAEAPTPILMLDGSEVIPDQEDEWGNKLTNAEQGKGQIVLSVLDPNLVFPLFDEHDRDRMIECQIIYFVTDPNDPEGDPVIYRETYTRDTITIQLGENDPVETPNLLREIPVVHIPNYKIAGRKYGKSDIHDIINLQIQLNEKVTDISDIITYHAAPITIVQGGKVQGLEKGARKVWSGLAKDAKVFNLEVQSDLKASREHVLGLKQSMHELTGVPESSLGKDLAISNTSGVALSIMYQPLLDKRNMKMTTYGPGLQKINRLIIKFGEVMKLITIPEETVDKYKTVVDWGDPLPKDELIALQVSAQEIALGLKSRHTVMKERGIKNPEQEFARWLEETKQINEVQAQIQMQVDAAKAEAAAANRPAGQPGKSNNPSGKAASATDKAAKSALRTNLSGQDTSTYRPEDAGKKQGDLG